MSSRYANVIGITVTAVGLMMLVLPGAATAHGVAAEIEKVRIASQRFADVKVALAEGYVPAPPGECISAAHEGLPPEWGAMGIHYVNPKILKMKAGGARVDGGSDAQKTKFYTDLYHALLGRRRVSDVDGKYLVFVEVHPDHHKQGYGGQFYDFLMGELARVTPTRS